MIRLIHCIRKRDDTSLEEFRTWWQSPEFDLLLQRMASFMGARRFTKNATLAVDANLWLMEARNLAEPFDGVIEYWWDNAAHLMEVAKGESFQVLREEMENFQRQFIDLDRALIFFTEGN